MRYLGSDAARNLQSYLATVSLLLETEIHTRLSPSTNLKAVYK